MTTLPELIQEREKIRLTQTSESKEYKNLSYAIKALRQPGFFNQRWLDPAKREKQLLANKERYATDPTYRRKILEAHRKFTQTHKMDVTHSPEQIKLNSINARIVQLTKTKSFRHNVFRKGNNTLTEYLGCSIEAWKFHVEQQFQDGMKWENIGVVWHLARLSSWKKACKGSFTRFFHWSNVYPKFYIRLPEEKQLDNGVNT